MKITYIKKFAFYFGISFLLAVSGYYFLKFIIPGNHVFGSWVRMFNYQEQHPIAYIAIPCFFYALIIPNFDKQFLKADRRRQILLTVLICLLVILISSPFGGMLWFYHDMQAGYFPANWFFKMVSLGIPAGIEIGWLIMLISFPITFLGIVSCFFVTRFGSRYL